MCCKMMIITFYFKDELQSLENDHYASICSVHNRVLLPKKSKSEHSSIMYEASEILPFIPQIYSCVRQRYSNIECSWQVLDSSILGEIWVNLYLRFFSNKWKIPLKPC